MSETKELDQDKIKQIREEFDFFDSDKNGEIDVKEFYDLLKVLSPKAKESQAKEGFDMIDTNGDGSVDFEEFLVWWQNSWWEY